MTVRNDIKILLIKENLTLVELATELSTKTGKKVTADSISQKLRRNSMKYDEAKEIFDCLGYDIELKKRNEI